MTRIIAVRHAQSEGNLAHFCCGHTDISLTPMGMRQAEETARFLDAYPLDRIYSSDLLRVVMTARPTAERRGMEIIRDIGLREINVGDWEGMPHSELDRCDPAREAWHHDFVNAACPGGESVRELVDYYKVDETAELIVISDDVSMDVGKVRIRKKGSAGGHNGLKSLIEHLGHDNFIRVKIGVGEKPKGWDLADYVLGRFSGPERETMNETAVWAADAIRASSAEGADVAMNKFNR